MYDRWDSANKYLHRDCLPWRPFTELAEQAVIAVYQELALDGDPTVDTAGLLGSMVEWPLWPDVTAAALAAIGTR